MHHAISDKKDELAQLSRRYGVARQEVFGSAARRTDFEPPVQRRELPGGVRSPEHPRDT